MSPCEAIGACVVIPVYNHARTVGDVVRDSLKFAKTVLVCDDGSTDGSGAAAKAAGAELITHPVNQGKGAALRTLFEEASRRGFRYAISLDADGQHYPKDIPGIAEAVQKQPGALVVGSRDLIAARAPASSEFGRKFGNFWVWFEGGQALEDNQSGFRAYPLPETLALMGGRSRYDFEVEVLLRASWAGLPLTSTKIDVLYPTDRVTHFRPFKDNARVALLNFLTIVRLLLPFPMAPLLRPRKRRPGLSLDAIRRWFWLGGPGPVWRTLAVPLAIFSPWAVAVGAALGIGALPTLLAWWALTVLEARVEMPVALGIAGAGAFAFGLAEWLVRRRLLARADAASPRKWDGKSKSGALGYLIFVAVVKVFGRWPADVMLHFVNVWFLVFATSTRRASMQFLDRAIGPATGLKAWARAYRHLAAFGHTIIDRIILGVKGPEHFTRVGAAGVAELVDNAISPKGAILLTAHLGSWEMASGLLGKRLKVPFDIVAYDGEEPQMREAIERSSEKWKPNLLLVGKGELAALDIMRALRAGHLVALQGDRTVDQRTIAVDFLGSPAHFPVGPFVVAALSGATMVPGFNIRLDDRRYEVFAVAGKTYQFDRKRDRDAQIREWVQDYVRVVEGMARKHPYQWFNFYDFWAAPAVPAVAPTPTSSPATSP